MRALTVLTFLFFIFKYGSGQDVYEDIINEEVYKLIRLSDVCTCSEISDMDRTHLELYVQCTEFDRIENVADLDKIEWPANPNGLKISATFDGLGLSTLGKLPPNSLVETLKFTNNIIKAYWPDPFSEVPNLKILSFSHNDLTAITPDLFTNIEGLEELDLSYNKLSDFNPIDFKQLRHLKRLNLQSNNLKRVPLDALQPMVALEDLDLSKNGIFDLLLQRNEVENLARLKRLNLNDNRIRSITKDTFPANNSLELLVLSNNIIEIIEEDAFLTCTNLRELNLAQNNITFLFTMPPALQIAMLKINTFYHWPTFPSGIKYIDLSYNRLTDLYDEEANNFDSLEVLNIGGNQIKNLQIKKKLPNLYILDISYTLISEIPRTISTQYFPNLEELHLDGNPIETVYFKNIIAVKRLYMNEMKLLRVVEDKAFSNVVGRADEAESELHCFSLSLSNCPSLWEIRPGAFDGTSLCKLDISRNNLTFLPKILTDWSEVVEGVNLQYNPWHCTCDMQWVVDELLPQTYATNNSGLLDELRCGSPRGVEGLRLVHWYNWTERAMCDQDIGSDTRHGNYMLESSTENFSSKYSTLTLILGACIIVTLLISIALSVYLIKTRKKYRVRRAAMKRKRQSATDINNGHKDQFTNLNTSKV
ncbi:leucine-rich repeat-containing G-protein coupled receptor 5-like [Trichoplusia ni]|uniref:Leucine-rich repeat-containing G-protein coupled receptor 5-like n=1 Tax=Trichoplusia ni TaxID=7111 RepID=A0A7E5VKY3_TRINI|nr:leucine-rich repeat-containing G-protein coupled receptor 5-like [Trichoplusia ni]